MCLCYPFFALKNMLQFSTLHLRSAATTPQWALISRVLEKPLHICSLAHSKRARESQNFCMTGAAVFLYINTFAILLSFRHLWPGISINAHMLVVRNEPFYALYSQTLVDLFAYNACSHLGCCMSWCAPSPKSNRPVPTVPV